MHEETKQKIDLRASNINKNKNIILKLFQFYFHCILGMFVFVCVSVCFK